MFEHPKHPPRYAYGLNIITLADEGEVTEYNYLGWWGWSDWSVVWGLRAGWGTPPHPSLPGCLLVSGPEIADDTWQTQKYSLFNNNKQLVLLQCFYIMRYFSKSLPPVTGFNIKPALIVQLLNSMRSILARRLFRGTHMPHHAINNVCILPGTHLYTWVESSNVDKVSCWRTRVAGIDGNQTRNPLIQSHRFNPI